MPETVVVVGAGIAGLSAALELSKDFSVVVLEARDRLGGRIHTVRGHEAIPYELGAEFIHGKAPEIWTRIQDAGLKVTEVPDRHWKETNGARVELHDFWEQVASVTEEINHSKVDRSFAEFLSHLNRPKESVELAKGFVEGFHAAPLDKASIQAVRLNEESSEKIEAQRNFRLNGGFDQLVEYFARNCSANGVRILPGRPVRAIHWKNQLISIWHGSGKLEELRADRVIMTISAGVLKSKSLEITPMPAAKMEALNLLEMGTVTKVVLHFRARFWPEPNFGFIYTDDEWFATWWADHRGDILTAWAGGPQGARLSARDTGFIIHRALEGAAKLFGETLPRVQNLLIAANTHNWGDDPFSKGGYSYIPVNALDACKELAWPESGRLFFAGEATALNYQFGTVHGAISSGMRAARDVVKASRGK